MFHSHHDEMTQMGMGLIGMFVIHPRNPAPEYHVDRDFAIMLSEWDIPVGTARPNTLEMTDFNVLTMNGKVFRPPAPHLSNRRQGAHPLGQPRGDGPPPDPHPRLSLPGHRHRREDIPLSAQWPETTVLVGVGQTRTIEFIADAPGDWAFHCHMTHHVMNQMGHEFPNMGVKPGDLDETIRPLLPGYMTMGHTGMDMGRMAEVMPMPPNSIPMKGAGPFGDYISMGGMFTIIKVRDRLTSYEKDPGWYQHPRGTVALKASAAELDRDGIDVQAPTAKSGSRGHVAPTPGHTHR